MEVGGSMWVLVLLDCLFDDSVLGVKEESKGGFSRFQLL